MVVAGAFAVYTGHGAYTRAQAEIMARFEGHPEFNLLEAVTCYEATPHSAILFLKNNHLDVNLAVEWTQAGPVMFYAPNAKVFMDGRAQQVYDEAHYKKYAALLVSQDTPRNYIMKLLDMRFVDGRRTNGVLLRRRRSENLWTTLEQSGQWVLVLTSMQDGLFFRKGSQPLEQLGTLLRRNEEWRPNMPWAIASRGFVWQAITPPEPEQALDCWKDALERSPTSGYLVFRPLTDTLRELGRGDEARQLIEEYFRKLNRPVAGLPDGSRLELLKILADCWNDIRMTPEGSHGAGSTSAPAPTGRPETSSRPSKEALP